MGSLGCLGDICSAPFLGLQGDSMEQLCAESKLMSDSEWHSISLDDSSRLEVEYRFQLVNDDSHACKQGAHRNVSEDMEAGTFQFALCGLSRGKDDDVSETKSLVSCPNSIRSDRAFVTMEALGGSNGVKEVRVCFLGLDDGAKENVEAVSSNGETHCSTDPTSGVSNDRCLHLVSGVKALISGAKLSLRWLLSGANKSSLWGSYFQAGYDAKHSYASASFVAKVDPACKAPPATVVKKMCNAGSRDVFNDDDAALKVQDRKVFPPSDVPRLPDSATPFQQRTDASPWKRDGDQRKVHPQSPSAGSKPPVYPNCKKPPRPPRSPSDIAAAAEKRAARKRMEKTSPKRKPRVPPPPSAISLTPLIALVLTIGFGILMVFQGVFVQNNVSYGKAKNSFVDDTGIEQSTALTFSANPESHLFSAASFIDVRLADSVVANAFHKSMLDLHRRKRHAGAASR